MNLDAAFSESDAGWKSALAKKSGMKPARRPAAIT
jgi:hypothetical protein